MYYLVKDIKLIEAECVRCQYYCSACTTETQQ